MNRSRPKTCPDCLVLRSRVASLEAELTATAAKQASDAAERKRLLTELAALRARVGQNSTNSSRPPSSDGPHVPPKARPRHRRLGRKQGGQPGHPGRTRPLAPESEVAVWAPEWLPAACTHCQADIPKNTPLSPRLVRHQVWDLPPVKPILTEYRQRACTCPECGKLTWAPWDPSVPRRHSGPRLMAHVGALTGQYGMSRRNTRRYFQEVLGCGISLGTVSNLEGALNAVLAPAYEEVAAAVRASPAVNVDETRWRLGASHPYLWVAATPELCFLRIDPKRSRAALELLLPPNPNRCVTSDRYSAYYHLAPAVHAYCWSHLDRDFLALADPSGPGWVWADCCLRVADDVFSIWRRFQDVHRSRALMQCELRPVQDRLHAWLTLGVKQGSRKMKACFRQLLKNWDCLWVFSTTEGVEPTNNLAERLLRRAVIWRKTSYGSQSDRGCIYVQQMLTVTGTLRQRGRNTFDYFVRACEAEARREAPPQLLAPHPDHANPAKTEADPTASTPRPITGPASGPEASGPADPSELHGDEPDPTSPLALTTTFFPWVTDWGSTVTETEGARSALAPPLWLHSTTVAMDHSGSIRRVRATDGAVPPTTTWFRRDPWTSRPEELLTLNWYDCIGQTSPQCIQPLSLPP